MFARVLIVGGGPSGSAAALTLARAGVDVVLLERSDYSAPRIGETVPPQVCVMLSQLGVWERFLRDCHLASPGTVSIWGDHRLAENDFIFNPYGHGWHLDRRLFDQMLLEAAEEAGVQVYRGARLLRCCPTETGLWEFQAVMGGLSRPGRAEFVIDATGRVAAVSRCLGSRRLVLDRLVGVVRFFQSGQIEEGDSRTLVEASDGGWWYSARLPLGRLVVAWMTDADLIPRGTDGLESYWRACLQRTAHTHQRVARAEAESELRVVSAQSSRLDRVAGGGWFAVGDAAMSFDPLSSQGIVTALESGRLAAECIATSPSRSAVEVERYVSWSAHRFHTYRREWADYYGRERRWPESPFWRRRQLRRTGR
jgi:flavin-dependent dehydrogenase